MSQTTAWVLFCILTLSFSLNIAWAAGVLAKWRSGKARPLRKHRRPVRSAPAPRAEHAPITYFRPAGWESVKDHDYPPPS